MNERIKLLAEQAGMVKILRQHAHEYGAGTFEDTEYPELEKFAELIVRECVGILEPKSRYMGEGPEVLKDKISQIKKHFGVEE